MKLSELGVKRPVTALVVFLFILMVGGISLRRIGIDLFPEITLPSLSIITSYPGADPEDIESKITKPIEENVSTIPNLKEINSVCLENLSLITLKFEWGTDLDAAANDVRDKLSLIEPELPEEAERPLIFKFDVSMMPILIFGITSSQKSYPKLREIVREKITRPLKRIPGVGAIIVGGGLERQINIELDRGKLEAHHLSIERIFASLRANNFNLPVGKLDLGEKEYTLRIRGEFRDISEIEETVLGSFGGKLIKLKDVARVEDSFEEPTSMVRINGRPGMYAIVQKQSGTNTVQVAEAVLRKLEEIKKELPPEVEIKLIRDLSDFIKKSIYNLTQTIFWAILFVILVTLFFLQNLSGSIIVALTLPFSLIIAFIFLYGAGYTINIISLSSLAIAVGMVVDNGIVVLENIFRHREEEGESSPEAAIFAPSEVGRAIIASTLTTISVFFPLIFTRGLISIEFRQLALVISIALAGSLFCSLYFTPTLSSRFLNLRPLPGSKIILPLLRGLERRCLKLLKFSLAHRRLVLSLGGALLLFTLFLSLFFLEKEFTPSTDEGFVQGEIKLPVGTKLEATEKVMEEIEKIVKEEVPEAKIMSTRWGYSQGLERIMTEEEGSYIGILRMRLVSKRKRERTDREIAHFLSQKVLEIPGVREVDFSGGDPMGTFFYGRGKPVVIEIYGWDREKTQRVAERVKELLLQIEGLRDISISREQGNPELWIKVDREKAEFAGLTLQDIARTLRMSIYGENAPLFRKKGEEYDIFVRLREKGRESLSAIENIVFPTLKGGYIPLKNIATIEKREGPMKLERKNEERLVKVEARPYKKALGTVVKEIEKSLSKFSLPQGVRLKFGGSVKEQKDAFQSLLFALLLGTVLVYLVMAAEFESFLHPFIIMLSVPFALMGVIWALLVTGKTLNIVSYVGMILLVGIVVNNGIVFVDYANLMRVRGFSLKDTLLLTGKRRLRPVLMTALCSEQKRGSGDMDTPGCRSDGRTSCLYSGNSCNYPGGLLSY